MPRTGLSRDQTRALAGCVRASHDRSGRQHRSQGGRGDQVDLLACALGSDRGARGVLLPARARGRGSRARSAFEGFSAEAHASQWARDRARGPAAPGGSAGASVETRTDVRPSGAAMASVSKTADDGKKTDGSKKTADGNRSRRGYHYHEQAIRGTAPAQPVKLSEASRRAREARGLGGSGLSSWNTAAPGRNERTRRAEAAARSCSKESGRRVGCDNRVNRRKSFEGDATVVMVRGKLRHGSTRLDLTFEWSSRRRRMTKPRSAAYDKGRR